MESTTRDRIIAITVALAAHAVVLLSFCATYLTWPPEDVEDERIPDDPEVLYVNDYINLGDMITNQTPADAPEAPSEGTSLSDGESLADGGEKGMPAPVVSSEQESPAKVRPKPVPEKKGPTKEELERIEQERREQASRDKIKNQMNFGGKGKGEGVSGVAEGNAVSGTLDGSAGHDLAGRRIISWGSNTSRKSGTIKIAVTVNSEGKVTSATYAGGDGAASADLDLRKRTIQASLATRFSPLSNSNRDQKGTLTWRFK
ncbi:MAG: hypothetical protein K2H59_04850 [Muribaculaceae bacterium]|nr:hypothetical protein [Muribaculaceae bacterium]